MKISKAIEKLEKLGLKVENNSFEYWVKNDKKILNFISECGEDKMVCINVRSNNEQIEYSTRVFFRSLNQALEVFNN